MIPTTRRAANRITACFALCAVLAAGTLAAATVVELPADPPSRRTVALTERWRIGADDQDVLLGVVTGVVVDPAGRTYLVDRQLSQVVVLAADGTYLTTLGREGDGPGELRNPHDLLLLDDAGTVGVIQGFPGRLIGLTDTGDPAGDITLGGDAEAGGFAFLRRAVRVGDRFVADTGRMVFDPATGQVDRRTSLAAFDRDGELLVTFAEHTQQSDLNRAVYDEAAESSAFDQWAAGLDGHVYLVPEREEFVIEVRDLAGEALMTWRRPFTTRQRTEADREEVAGSINIVVAGRRQEPENKALPTDPAIMGLDVGADGAVYVTSCHNVRDRLPAGTAARYDVISPDGVYREELTLTVPGFAGEEDALLFIDGRRFLLVKNFEGATAAMTRAPGEDDAEEDEADGAAADDVAPLEVVFLTLD